MNGDSSIFSKAQGAQSTNQDSTSQVNTKSSAFLHSSRVGLIELLMQAVVAFVLGILALYLVCLVGWVDHLREKKMGAVCCGPKLKKELTEDPEARLHPLSPSDIRLVAEATQPILLWGPRAVGKTLFFLRLVFPEIDVPDLVNITKETNEFHVELIQLAKGPRLLWDVRLLITHACC